MNRGTNRENALGVVLVLVFCVIGYIEFLQFKEMDRIKRANVRKVVYVSPWTHYQTTKATWYGTGHWARRYPSTVFLGVNLKMKDAVCQCANNELPLMTVVRITNLANGKSVKAVVSDRGKLIPGVKFDLNAPLFDSLAGSLKSGIMMIIVDTLRE
jgi:rare lipoprotein A (peptidoglycan hydrolase)